MSDAEIAHIKKLQQDRNAARKLAKNGFDPRNQRTDDTKASLTEALDKDLYDGKSGADRFAGYNTSIDVTADADNDDDTEMGSYSLVGNYTASKEIMNEFAHVGGDLDVIQDREQKSQIGSRMSDYQKKAYDRPLDSVDATFKQRMDMREIEREEHRLATLVAQKDENMIDADDDAKKIEEPKASLSITDGEPRKTRKRKSRWAEATEDVSKLQKEWIEQRAADDAATANGDADTEANSDAASQVNGATNGKHPPMVDGSDNLDPQPANGTANGATSKPDVQMSDDSAEVAPQPARSRRWDAMPEPDSAVDAGSANIAPQPARSKRWDAPPAPGVGLAGPSRWDVLGVPTGAAPAPAGFGGNAGRNSSWSDEELDMILPGEEQGYRIVQPPAGYQYTVGPRRAPPRTSVMGGFMQQESVRANIMGKDVTSENLGVGELLFFKENDKEFFAELFDASNEDDLSVEDLKRRKIKRLILKVKNGTPPMRKTALRQITDNARAFGADALFAEVLPLLMQRAMDPQERHLLVKVVDRILYKLDDLVRPYAHRILVVIMPMLIDGDYYARVEAREVITNLAKAAGLAHMISVLRPEIDHIDENVRNTTARCFAITASALGIPSLLPFLKAVCRSKKSWTARHTGVKIVQQIAIQMGCAVLPYLQTLVECCADGLQDEQMKVRTMTALSIAALAEASAPYGIESFDSILKPLWLGARKSRGKGLAAFLKAVGYIIPLMDEEYANYYTTNVMQILLREFHSPDEEMRKIVLKVLSQAAGTNGVTPAYLKEEVLDEFFKSFWVRRLAMDPRSHRQVIETTVDLSHKVGAGVIIDRIVNNLKDENEGYRKMTLETIEKVVSALGAADISERLEERLVDGLLFAFHEQGVEDLILLNGFGTVVNALGTRMKPYLQQVVSLILWRLNHKNPAVRQQAADLVSRVAVVIQQCEESTKLNTVSSVLYEQLGEEFPEVLGSVLGALRAIVTVVGLETMQPPVRDLLPRLTPILRNRNEKVQENTIDLVGRIADRGAESVPSREWMRIVFELLDMLKAHKKGIRRAANNTFGFIAKAIGPSDVLATLLNNLRTLDRQSRVCTAVAIGIVAETCQPFTVIPSLMSEYRVPELNVQNGVLKALTFVFEYIGEMSKDYVYAVTPLLEDALVDRDQVHRQTAANVVKHLALGVVGLGCEDAMLHLLNLLVPNLFETSPHVIDRIVDGINAIRNVVGTGIVMNYFMSMLFHPARKVRNPGWRLYNETYVQSADAMVPYYPDLPDHGCVRHELKIVL